MGTVRAAALATGALLFMSTHASAANAECQKLIDAGQRDEALECYRAAVKKFPDDVDARNSFATLLAERKKYQSALTEFEEVLKRSPKDGIALNGRGMMLLALGRAEEGAKALQFAIETDHDNIQALHNLAALNFRYGHLDVAVPLWQRVLKVSPEDPDALLGMGEVYMRQGKLDEAFANFNKVLAKNDRHSRALWLAGKVVSQKSPVDAIPYFERAASLAGDEPDPWYDLGLARMFANDWRLAGQAFNMAYKYAPEDPRPILQLGKVHIEMRRYDDAIAHFDEVMKLKPTLEQKVEVRFHMGRVREAQGNKQKAQDEYLQALALDPKYLPARLNLAALHLEAKRYDAAKTELDRALEIAPNSPIARFNLGKLLLVTGKPEQGKKELRALQTLLPATDPLRQEAEALLAGRRPE